MSATEVRVGGLDAHGGRDNRAERSVAFHECGDPAGVPLIHFHGTRARVSRWTSGPIWPSGRACG